MRIDILTLFPQMFASPFAESIVKRAIDQNIVHLNIVNFRGFAHDKHQSVDDYAYGGGAGMVLKPEPLFEAVETLVAEGGGEKPPVILLTPQGRLFSQAIANELANRERLILICGHYEGIDERVREHLVTDEISIGDYVLTGGELPAMVLVDAVVRLIPKVLAEDSAACDSHMDGLLEYPQYTRPEKFRNWAVPEILLSGNHAVIAKWRREQSIKRTLERRPDLLSKAKLTDKEQEFILGS